MLKPERDETRLRRLPCAWRVRQERVTLCDHLLRRNLVVTVRRSQFLSLNTTMYVSERVLKLVLSMTEVA
jgi:hypothetical protein